MIRLDACGDPLNLEGEGICDEPVRECYGCAEETTGCEWVEGFGWICTQCLTTDERERGEDDGREYADPRDEQDERRYR